MITAKEAHEEAVYSSGKALTTYCETKIHDAATFGDFSVCIDAKEFKSADVIERVLEQLREVGYDVLEDPDCEDSTEFEIRW